MPLENNPLAEPAKDPDATKEIPHTVAADFVDIDTDRPHADENAADIPPPTPQSELQGKKRGPGRPRKETTNPETLRSRERYERKKSERAAPPSFSDLPGGNQAGKPEQPAPIPGTTPVNYKAQAEGYFLIGATILSNAIGPEWGPRSESEKDSVVEPLAKYMEANQWTELSPGLQVLMMIALYGVARMNHPNTKEKILSLAKKIRGDEKKPETHKKETVNYYEP
jgi:hypothetical protein